MSVNRYLNPLLLQYQSQFVPEQIPWEILQGSAERKQKTRDDFGASAMKLGDITPAGLDYTVDHYGNTINVGDYTASMQEVQQLKNKLADFSKEFSNVELNKDHYSKIAELQKEYNQIAARNDFRNKRAEGLKAIQDQRVKDKVNPGDARGVWYQQELMKLLSPEGGGYIPQLQAHQDVFDESKFVVEATSLINSELQSIGAGASGQYLTSYKRTGRLPDKVKNVFDGAFNSNQELQQLIKMEAIDAAIKYSGGKSDDPNQVIEVTDAEGNKKQMSLYDVVKENKYQNMLAQAMGRVSSDGSQGISANQPWKWNYDIQKEAEANLPIVTPNKEIKDTSPFVEYIKNANLKETFEKSLSEMFSIESKLKTMNPNDPNQAEDYANLQNKYRSLSNMRASYLNNFKKAETNIINENKDLLLKTIDDEIAKAGSNKVAGTSGSLRPKDLGIYTKEEQAQIAKLKQLKEKLKNETSVDVVRSEISKAGFDKQYESLITDAMQGQDFQQEYYGLTYDESTPDGKAKNNKVKAYLAQADYDFADADGNAVTFETGEFLPGFQTGELPDGRTFVTVTEKVGKDWTGNPRYETKTVVVDKADYFFVNLQEQTAADAKAQWIASGGTDELAKETYNRTMEGLAYRNVITADNPTSTAANIGKLNQELKSKTEGQMVTGIIQYPDVDVMVTGTKLKDGRVDIRFAIPDPETKQWVPFQPQGDNTLNIYNDFAIGIQNLTKKVLK